jgi:phage protein D
MQAIYSVVVAGQDISTALNPILLNLSVSLKSGGSSDTASLTIDDTGGRVILPGKGDPITIKLGWQDKGIGTVFAGTVDEVNAEGGRSGRTLSISAKGVDTNGKAKQGQRRHFDNATVKDALSAAGQTAGVDVKVDPSFASITRPYIALDDESFLAFGERLARELGGTFKIVGTTAVLAKRNGGVAPSGAALPTITAAWGDNLHEYSIKPLLGRPVEKTTLSRWYDSKSAAWKSKTAETGTDGATTTKPSIFTEADEDRATEQSSSDAVESDRKSGEGSATIEGDINAQPEGNCIVSNCRDGVDGTYRIDSVDHSYSRSGFTTSLQLRQPKGSAGKDSR